MDFKKWIASALCISLLSCLYIPVYAEGTGWGLGYGASGSKPTGNSSAEELKGYNAYYVGAGEEKVVYLTFDAGYENNHTDKILNVLKENQVPAAFFVVGTYIRDNPELIKRMVVEGHIVGNHSMNHPDMTKMDKTAFTKELEDTEKLYQEVTGQAMPKYYRPPRGQYSRESMQMANELGYKTIFWSLAYVDWLQDDQPTKEQAFSKLLPRLHPGTILLLHSTSATNADILDELIKEYKKMGYEFKGLDQLR